MGKLMSGLAVRDTCIAILHEFKENYNKEKKREVLQNTWPETATLKEFYEFTGI